MSKIELHLTVCPTFTSAVVALAAALSGKVEQDTPSNIIPIGKDTGEGVDPEPKPAKAGRGRPAKEVKEEPKEEPKVDLNKRHEDLCTRARDLIKAEKVTAAAVKALAKELGADKLSELKPTAATLDAVEAKLDAIESGEDSDDGV